MAKQLLHLADSRGHVNHGWLDAHHSFSFGSYYDPTRVHFGMLRVLNEDWIDGGMGFGEHPHDNMEIITIPLHGSLAHKDSMGNASIIQHGDIQVMSAGTGIFHSEFNGSKQERAHILQIWVFPHLRNVVPRYDQITLAMPDRENKFQQIVSPYPGQEGVWIHQNAWFHLGKFDKDFNQNYRLKNDLNGVYCFVIDGTFTIEGQTLKKGDGFGLWEIIDFDVKAIEQGSEILLMEVPMR